MSEVKSEGLEVVGYLNDVGLHWTRDSAEFSGGTVSELMAVTQHEQLIAARDARIAELEDRPEWVTIQIQQNTIEDLRAELAALREQVPVAWFTEDHLTDKSATTYSHVVAVRWEVKGWPVSELYAAPVAKQVVYACPRCGTGMQADPDSKPVKPQVVMPERLSYYADLTEITNSYNDGWNDCLDELSRLNAADQEGGV
jgi:hypothetical protein